MVVERELRSRFVAEGLVGFIGAKVAVFDKNGLLAIGKLECVDPHHLNLYLRDAWVLRNGEPYYTPKLLVKGEVLARVEITQPGGPYLDHRGEIKVERRKVGRKAKEFEL